MSERFYFHSILLSGVIGLTMAALLAGLQIRHDEGLRKYNRARWCLSAAFAVFGLMNLMEALLYGTSEEETGSLTGCVTIIIGSLLAMFFTMTVLSFIRPEIVTRKSILAQLAVIVTPGTLLIVLYFQAPQPVFDAFFMAMLAAYILLMVLYTRLFVRNHRSFKERMLAFYEEEDLVPRLQWINGTFWLSLATGVASLMFLANNLALSGAVNMIFSVCFLLICVFFVNFRPYAIMVDRTVTNQPPRGDTPPAGEKSPALSDLKEKVETWVRNKGYLDNTKSVEDIACEMGLWYPSLKDYIQQTTGEEFRAWRLRLRIGEAERLMRGNPDLPISRVVTMAGFNDRAFFYRCFQRITGRSVKEYMETFR